LLEISALWKAAEARKWWNNSYSAKHVQSVQQLSFNYVKACLPSIDVIKDLLCPRLAMRQSKVLNDPLNEVVFECPLDQLMEDVRCY
jgi:hypothetical protein